MRPVHDLFLQLRGQFSDLYEIIPLQTRLSCSHFRQTMPLHLHVYRAAVPVVGPIHWTNRFPQDHTGNNYGLTYQWQPQLPLQPVVFPGVSCLGYTVQTQLDFNGYTTMIDLSAYSSNRTFGLKFESVN